MEKSYQQIIIELVQKLYPGVNQEASRKILTKYYTEPGKRRLTLEELGREVHRTRERARQIRDGFRDDVLPKKIRALDGQNNLDLRDLRKTLETIVSEIHLLDRPIFADRMQDILRNKGILNQNIYVPVAIDLLKAFQIDTKFKTEEFGESILIVNKNDNEGKYTDGITAHAKRIARHCCGLFSVNKLIEYGWSAEAPKSIQNIPEALRKLFVLDILHTDPSVLFLQNSEFYAFGDGDERISSILVPIFYAYNKTIDKRTLIGSIKRTLVGELKRASEEIFSGKETYLDVIETADLAIDEYCSRILLLESEMVDFRVPGIKIREKIKNYQPKGIYRNQIRVLEKIRANGKPLDSDSFGEICSKELKIPESQNSHIYSYSTLYYRDGERRNGHYKTLDGSYVELDNEKAEINYRETEYIALRIKSLKEKITNLWAEQENLDIVAKTKAKSRAEQAALREILILLSPKSETATELFAARCQICNKYYPTQLLVAAHVKPRAECNPEEKKDLENIAMLQCKSCDSLFENGFISVNEKGIVIVNIDIPLTDDLVELLSRVEGNLCDYINGNERRASYMEYHRATVFF